MVMTIEGMILARIPDDRERESATIEATRPPSHAIMIETLRACEASPDRQSKHICEEARCLMVKRPWR